MHHRKEDGNALSTGIIGIGTLLCMLLIAGCAKATSPTPTAGMLPTESSSPTAVEVITPTETIIEDQIADAADSNCISCHMDKDQLINTADPVEKKESESSGEG